MVRMADLPHDLAVPVHLEGGAGLESLPGRKALHAVLDLAAVEQVPVVEEIAVRTRPVGQAPGVSDGAVHVHQVHGAVAEHRGEQRVAGERPGRIVRD